MIQALGGTVAAIFILFAIAIGVVGLLSSIYKWILIFKYRRLNALSIESGKTGEEVAKELLERLEINDVKVEKVGFWMGLFLGNHYNATKKIIKLRKNIFNSPSITATAIAAEKVALAERHKNGDKRVKTRQVLALFGYFAPVVFIPLIVVGIIIDMVVLEKIGVFSITFTAVSLAYFILGCVAMSLNVKLEKVASARAEELLKTSSLMNDSELAEAHTLYKTYITSYIIDYIYTVMYVIWLTIKLIVKIIATTKK